MKPLLTLMTLSALASGACAADQTYQFSYTGLFHGLSGNIVRTLSGSLLGSLQPDQNTILVSQVSDDVRLSGFGYVPSFEQLLSMSQFFFGRAPVPVVVSFDGTVMDIAATNLAAREGFGLFARPGDVQTPYLLTGEAWDLAHATFVSSQWQIVQTSAVPEPATMLLMALGAAGLLGWRRPVPRRSTAHAG